MSGLRRWHGIGKPRRVTGACEGALRALRGQAVHDRHARVQGSAAVILVDVRYVGHGVSTEAVHGVESAGVLDSFGGVASGRVGDNLFAVVQGEDEAFQGGCVRVLGGFHAPKIACLCQRVKPLPKKEGELSALSRSGCATGVYFARLTGDCRLLNNSQSIRVD